MAKETFQRAITIARKHLKENPEKHRAKLGDLLMDIYTQLYSILESEKDFDGAIKVVDEQTDLTKELYGAKSY